MTLLAILAFTAQFWLFAFLIGMAIAELERNPFE